MLRSSDADRPPRFPVTAFARNDILLVDPLTHESDALHCSGPRRLCCGDAISPSASTAPVLPGISFSFIVFSPLQAAETLMCKVKSALAVVRFNPPNC